MSIFKRRPPAASAANMAPNPYLDARRRWNSREGSLIAARLIWQIAGIVSLLIALASVAGLIYLGSQPKFVPYVVEVDQLGQARAATALARAAPVDQRMVKAAVIAFVANARLVTPDIALQRKAIFDVYAMLASQTPASNKMTAFLNSTPELNPFKRAEAQTVNSEITSAIPLTPHSWQVDWKEIVRNRRTGAIVDQPYRMRAVLTLKFLPDLSGQSEAQMLANPLGIYVSDYAWSKQN
ncbi:conjugal transfer protein TrbF [Dyella marensis]|uniref:VirB8/TrbF family protein n=1 Tax=Dyella marensis TaxID=500610 RepID=UPI0031D8F6C3